MIISDKNRRVLGPGFWQNDIKGPRNVQNRVSRPLKPDDQPCFRAFSSFRSFRSVRSRFCTVLSRASISIA